jgi:hypothetical protein
VYKYIYVHDAVVILMCSIVGLAPQRLCKRGINRFMSQPNHESTESWVANLANSGLRSGQDHTEHFQPHAKLIQVPSVDIPLAWNEATEYYRVRASSVPLTQAWCLRWCTHLIATENLLTSRDPASKTLNPPPCFCNDALVVSYIFLHYCNYHSCSQNAHTGS